MQKTEVLKKNHWFDLLVFVLFVNVFLFRSFGAIALWLLIWGMWLLLNRLFGSYATETPQVKVVGTLVLAVSMVTYLSVSSPEKLVLLVLLTVGVMFISVYTWLKREYIEGILELTLTGVNLVREYLRRSWSLARGFLSGRILEILPLPQTKQEKSPWIKSVVVGMIVGLPLVVWLVFTLTKADPIFATFTKQLVNEQFLNDLPARAFISVFIFLLLVPLLLMQWSGYRSPLAWMTKIKFGREMSVITMMVALVMGVFLIVQWPYVFVSVAKETDLSTFGVATYSEYVKKGFGDLIKVVLMVFAVAWSGLLFSRNQDDKEKRFLILAQSVLGLEFVVFIVSLFRRVYLYQSYHGLTLARMYGLALLILIVGLMVTMAMRYSRQNVRFVRIEMAWIVVVLLGSIWLNMEGLIVNNPPTVNNRVDYVYLSRMSLDGYIGWQKSLDWSSQMLEKFESWDQHYGVDERREIYYSDLTSRNLAYNYHKLIMQYGSQDEIREYKRKVIQSKKEYVELFNIESFSYEEATGFTQYGMTVAPKKMRKMDYLAKLDGSLKELDNSKSGYNIEVEPQRGSYFRAWDWMKSNPHMDYDLGYFRVGLVDNVVNKSKIDQMLIFSPREYQIYQILRDSRMIDRILESEVRAMKILQRIGLQAENERGFDVDISLDSPFLR